jgi:hypothetical protein
VKSPGFEIAIAQSRAVPALRWAMLALGGAGLLLAAWLARDNQDGWVLLAFGVLMLWVGWRHGRLGLAWGVLRVDAAGVARWTPTTARGAHDAREDGMPATVERWFAGERLVWLRLRTSDGRRHEILCGRGTIDDESWRRLASWLTWSRRGRAA